MDIAAYQQMLWDLAGPEPLDTLAATPARLRKLTAGMTASTLLRKPQPDKWCIQEIAGHLTENEFVLAYRIRKILIEDTPRIEGYEADKLAEVSDYRGWDLEDMLDLFERLRRLNLRLLGRLSAEQWRRAGEHTKRGRETLAQLVQLTAGHDVNHMRQIEAILAKGAPE